MTVFYTECYPTSQENQNIYTFRKLLIKDSFTLIESEFFYLCHCLICTLSWILYKPIWKQCSFVFAFVPINEPLSPLLYSCKFEETVEYNKELIGISLSWMKPFLVKFHWQQVWNSVYFMLKYVFGGVYNSDKCHRERSSQFINRDIWINPKFEFESWF